MIHNPKGWQRWKVQWQRKTRPNPEAHFRILGTSPEMARVAGACPSRNLLRGLEVDFQLAKRGEAQGLNFLPQLAEASGEFQIPFQRAGGLGRDELGREFGKTCWTAIFHKIQEVHDDR